MTGLDAIAAMFAHAKEQNRAAFLPFFMVGYPNYDESIDILAAMAAEGADGFEIGIPFSDPLADGPTIQAASQVALENGIGVVDGLRAVRDLRGRGVHQAILLFSYLNPVLAYGVERFILDAKAAGAQGFIIPDLPPGEGEPEQEEEEAAVSALREALDTLEHLAQELRALATRN